MAWKVFVYGALLTIMLGVAATFLGDKGHFLIWLTQYRNPVTDGYFYYVTRLGEEYGFIVIGLMLWLRSWRKMIVIPSLGLAVMLVSFLLKKVFFVVWPLLYLKRMGWDGPMAVMDYHLLTGHASFQMMDYHLLTGHASFPSGHSMAAWALFTLTAGMVRKTWVSVLCLVLAVSVSLSRVYLMAHFLRDVVAGAAIGFAIGYAFLYAYERFMKSRQLEETFGPVSETDMAEKGQ